MIEIKVGQTWKDVDKRRESDGTVRVFVISQVGENVITASIGGKVHWFNRSRFGSGRKNDSFALVKDIGPAI